MQIIEAFLVKKFWISVASNFLKIHILLELHCLFQRFWVSFKDFLAHFLVGKSSAFFLLALGVFLLTSMYVVVALEVGPFLQLKQVTFTEFFDKCIYDEVPYFIWAITNFLLWHIFKQTSYVHKCCNNFVQKMWFHILSTTVWIKVSLCITISY